MPPPKDASLEVEHEQRMTRLEAAVSSLAISMGEFRKDVQAVVESQASKGKTNWALVIAAMSVLVTILMATCGGLWVLIQMQTNGRVQPMEIAVSQLLKASEIQNSESRLRDPRMVTLEAQAARSDKDREDLNKTTERLGTEQSRINGLLSSTISETRATITEIESQFKAADEYRNINLAGQMRTNALLWQRIYGEPYPTEVYFPSISRHSR